MKKVIITIDTEGHDGSNPVNSLIWGITGNSKEYGINHIMDICDRFSARALFFVDIAEAWDYGKDKIANVVSHILKRGHDVGVHIHPDHMVDKNRLFLWEYSKDEQFDIIRKCTGLYKEITGKQPVAFRAGKYGANRDTLDILNKLGYRFDFSQFYGQKWCRIDPPVAYVLPQRYRNIIEFPVTVYNSFKFGKLKRFDKIDAVMDPSEYEYIMNEISSNNNDIIVSLFYHSFSMLDWRENPDKPVFNEAEEIKFIKALKYIKDSECYEFVSLEYLCERYDQFCKKSDSIKNIIRTRGLLRSIWYLFNKAYSMRKTNKKAKLLVLSAQIISMVIFSTLTYILYIIFK